MGQCRTAVAALVGAIAALVDISAVWVAGIAGDRQRDRRVEADVGRHAAFDRDAIGHERQAQSDRQPGEEPPNPRGIRFRPIEHVAMHQGF